MKRSLLITILLSVCVHMAWAENTVVNISDFGVRPSGSKDMSGKIETALNKIADKYGKKNITIVFEPGVYNLHPEKARKAEYFISNHDQPNPKSVGLNLTGWENLTVNGNGAEFMCHGRMLPVALVNSSGCTLENLSIDFANPHIAQVTIEQSTDDGIVFRPEKWVKWRIAKKHRFITSGDGWELCPRNGIAFEKDSRRMVFNTSDLWCPVDSVVKLPDGSIKAPKWKDSRLKPGTKVVLRTWDRPAPGIFLSLSDNTTLRDIKVHYAEGMGLLAQMCDGVTLTRFNVCLRGDDDPRYFTTQADATHFSGCKGHIESTEGFYEGMMDDAINIHGTYLKIISRQNDNTVTGRYMHPQAYGFFWGEPGDSVQFIASAIMQKEGDINVIESITPVDKPEITGAKEFRISFRHKLPDSIGASSRAYGIENLTWSPTASFTHNRIRNNRARGTLFSTPRHTVVSDNVFDHTSGTAILLCGDCNGWYETGACRDVVIERNHFINSLTNRFQFTEAVISIYPEIPRLDLQTEYFHGGDGVPGIVIRDNTFETFDHPILYAKSINGLKFQRNRIITNTDYPEFHPNKFTFKLQKAKNIVISDNNFDHPENVSIDIE